MKKCTLSLFLLLVFSSVGVSFSQSITEIKEKYGQPTDVFSISENIWMTPQYTIDGQVCEMRLFPKRVSPSTNYLTGVLDVYQLRQVLNDLSPGKTNKQSFNGTIWGGGMFERIVNYENMTIHFIATLRGKIKFTKGSKNQVLNSEAEEQFPIPPETQIVEIRWRGRFCTKEKEK